MFSDSGSTSGQINPGAYFACRSSKIKPQKDASITLLLLTPVVSPTELAGDSVLSKFVSIAFFCHDLRSSVIAPFSMARIPSAFFIAGDCFLLVSFVPLSFLLISLLLFVQDLI